MERWPIDQKRRTSWARNTGYAGFAAARALHRPMTVVNLPVILPAFDAADDYIDDLIHLEEAAAKVRVEEMA
jgi:hypothetical protein